MKRKVYEAEAGETQTMAPERDLGSQASDPPLQSDASDSFAGRNIVLARFRGEVASARMTARHAEHLGEHQIIATACYLI